MLAPDRVLGFSNQMAQGNRKARFNVSLLHRAGYYKKEAGILGLAIITTASEEAYNHDGVTFICTFDENLPKESGKRMKAILRSTGKRFKDYWTDQDYQEVFRNAGFKVLTVHHPKATGKEGINWESEKKYSPFKVYALKKN